MLSPLRHGPAHRWLGAALTLALGLGCGRIGFEQQTDEAVPPGCDTGALEPNDDAPNASVVILDGTPLSAFLCSGDRDWYAVDLDPGDELAATLDYPTSGSYLWLELYEPDGVTPKILGVPSTDGASAWLIAAVPGRHYVRVRGRVSDAGINYQLTLDRVAQPHYFLAPGGDDAGPGTIAAPWATFGHALAQLAPGDTLVLLDGLYEPGTTGLPDVDCSQGIASGTADLPIRMVALNERRAHVRTDGLVDGLILNGCTYWTVEGLQIESRDNDAADTGGDDPNLAQVRNSSQIVLRRLLLHHVNRFSDADVLILGPDATDVLVEESEAYFFHRVGFSTWRSNRLTFRRNYQNSRGYPDLLAGDPLWPSGTAARDGYATDPPDRGGSSARIYNASESIIENNIGEGNTWTRFMADRTDSDVRFLGSIEFDTLYGFHSIPVGSDAAIISDLVVSHCVGLFGLYSGHWYRSTEGVQCDHCTSIGSRDRGIRCDRTSSPSVPLASCTCTDCLSMSSTAAGYYIADQDSWSVVNSVGFGNETLASPPETDPLMDVTELDPELGGCLVYLPTASPLVGAGSGGSDIGANITHRHVDGVLTDIPLWDPDTGAFPCGALISGVNDDPDTGCIGVHTRLAVGTADCPLPYDYP